MPEWSIGAVSKTVERFAFQGFESLSLRKMQVFENQVFKRFQRLAFYFEAIFTRLKSNKLVGLLPMFVTRLLTKRNTSS